MNQLTAVSFIDKIDFEYSSDGGRRSKVNIAEGTHSEHIWANGSIVAGYGTMAEGTELFKTYSRGRGGEIIDYSYTNTPSENAYLFNYDINMPRTFRYNGHEDMTSLSTHKDGNMLFDSII